jgi:predicted phosphoadenosine phosphosulfate sulfurtransferase
MAMQVYEPGLNVFDAAKKRIEFVFDNFETVHVSISGGKDSTVLAYLAIQEARKRGRKVGLFFLDEEVVYESTIKQIEYLMELDPAHTNRLWVQLPFALTNAVSLSEGQLICWEPGKHKQWMRPKKSYSIHAKPWDVSKETVKDKAKGFGFYDAIENFERSYSGVAWLVGLRATESMNRFRTMVKHPVDIGGEAVFWATRKGQNVTMYPIYDWMFSDIWKYIHEEKIKYSQIYDYQFKKGMPINEIRVSSLIHEKSFKSLCDLPEFEPKTYEKLCDRIKGIAFAQETGKSSKMFKVRKLPQGYKKWSDYRDFLIATYPDATKIEIFTRRFSKHMENEFVARQQCRQLVLNDYENNLPVENKIDPREALIKHYMEVL